MDQIRDLFSSIAPKYDLLNSVLSLGIDRRWRQRAVAHLKDASHVLDVCAGTLALTRELLTINPTCRITAVDFSQEMLRQGLENLSERGGATGGPATICSDFFQWNAPCESFDGTMCAYGMRNLDDNPVALKKIFTLLKPGGHLVILEFFRPDRWYTWVWNLTYAQFVLPAIGRLVSRHNGAYRHLRDSVRGFYTLDRYCNLLRESGFEVKESRRLTGGISGMIVAEKSPQPPFVKGGQGGIS